MKNQHEECYVRVTDKNWVSSLKKEYGNGVIEEQVNFWTTGTMKVRKYKEEELVLFKLHKDEGGKIVGCGYFDHHEKMTISEAWEKFGRRNGAESLDSLKESLGKYKEVEEDLEESAERICIILKNIIFFDEDKWIDGPKDWSERISTGRPYSNETEIGEKLLKDVDDRIILYTNA